MKFSRIKISQILQCFVLQIIAHFFQFFCFFNAESIAGV